MKDFPRWAAIAIVTGVVIIVYALNAAEAGAGHEEYGGTNWVPVAEQTCRSNEYVTVTFVHRSTESAYDAAGKPENRQGNGWNVHTWLYDNSEWTHWEFYYRNIVGTEPAPDRGVEDVDVTFFGVYPYRSIAIRDARTEVGIDAPGRWDLRIEDMGCIRNNRRNADRIDQFRVRPGDPDVDH